MFRTIVVFLFTLLLVSTRADDATAADTTSGTDKPAIDGMNLPALLTADWADSGRLVFHSTDQAVDSDGVAHSALLIEDAGALQTLKLQFDSFISDVTLDLTVLTNIAATTTAQNDPEGAKQKVVATAVAALTRASESVTNQLRNVAQVSMILKVTTKTPPSQQRPSTTSIPSTTPSPSSSTTTTTTITVPNAAANIGGDDCGAVKCNACAAPTMQPDPDNGCCACKPVVVPVAGNDNGVPKGTVTIIIVLVVLLVVVGGLFAFCCIRRTIVDGSDAASQQQQQQQQQQRGDSVTQPNAVYSAGGARAGGARAGGARAGGAPSMAKTEGRTASAASLISASSSRRGSDDDLLSRRPPSTSTPAKVSRPTPTTPAAAAAAAAAAGVRRVTTAGSQPADTVVATQSNDAEC